MDDLDILTLAEAADRLGVSATTLRHQVTSGRLRARKLGKTWITTGDEVERYRVQSLGQPGRPANLLEPKRPPFEDVTGRPGEPNLLEPRPRHRKWSEVKRSKGAP